jgi:hypothetical protein
LLDQERSATGADAIDVEFVFGKQSFRGVCFRKQCVVTPPPR